MAVDAVTNEASGVTVRVESRLLNCLSNIFHELILSFAPFELVLGLNVTDGLSEDVEGLRSVGSVVGELTELCGSLLERALNAAETEHGHLVSLSHAVVELGGGHLVKHGFGVNEGEVHRDVRELADVLARLLDALAGLDEVLDAVGGGAGVDALLGALEALHSVFLQVLHPLHVVLSLLLLNGALSFDERSNPLLNFLLDLRAVVVKVLADSISVLIVLFVLDIAGAVTYFNGAVVVESASPAFSKGVGSASCGSLPVIVVVSVSVQGVSDGLREELLGSTGHLDQQLGVHFACFLDKLHLFLAEILLGLLVKLGAFLDGFGGGPSAGAGEALESAAAVGDAAVGGTRVVNVAVDGASGIAHTVGKDVGLDVLLDTTAGVNNTLRSTIEITVVNHKAAESALVVAGSGLFGEG